MSTETLGARSVFDQVAMAGSAGAVARTSYAIRVLTDVVPQGLLDVTVTVPDELQTMLTGGFELGLYTRLYQEGFGGTVIDHYEPVTAPGPVFDPVAGTFTLQVPGNHFSAFRRADGQVELLMILAVDPTPTPSPTSDAASQFAGVGFSAAAAAAAQVCAFPNPVGSPLPGMLHLHDGFSSEATPERRRHLGHDYRAGIGTQVLAARDGVVELVLVQTDENDPTKTAGYGQWIQILHDDGTVTRYAHLQSGSTLSVGEVVVQGQVVGLSNATGANTAGEPVPPHLHFEYRVRVDRGLTAGDPQPCLVETPFSGVWVGAGAGGGTWCVELVSHHFP